MSLVHSPSVISSSSAVSMASGISLFGSDFGGPEHKLEDDAQSIPESQISTEPSLLSTLRASRIMSTYTNLCIVL